MEAECKQLDMNMHGQREVLEYMLALLEPTDNSFSKARHEECRHE